jgi:uncharacterized protein
LEYLVLIIECLMDKYLKVKVIPGAPKTEIKNTMADGTLKIAVAAAPEKGKANAALIKFLAEEFGVPKGNVIIISGATDRVKLIKLVISNKK